MESGLNKSKKNPNYGIYVILLGFLLIIIGGFAFSITETSSIDALGIEVELTTRPYATIGAILILLGIVGIIAGIVIQINDKSKIFPPQYPQQYYQPPPPQYYQHPPQQYYQHPRGQYYQHPNQPPQQVRYSPNCK